MFCNLKREKIMYALDVIDIIYVPWQEDFIFARLKISQIKSLYIYKINRKILI